MRSNIEYSANYDACYQYVIDRGINVIAQLVAKRIVGGKARYSLVLQFVISRLT